MSRLAKIGETADPYEQRWIMRSVGLLDLVRAGRASSAAGLAQRSVTRRLDIRADAMVAAQPLLVKARLPGCRSRNPQYGDATSERIPRSWPPGRPALSYA